MAASLTDLLTTMQNGVTAINSLQASNAYAFVNGNVRTTYLTNASAQVLAASATRKSILFHNPSDTIAVLVSPAVDSSSMPISPSFTSSARGGSFLLLPQDYLAFGGNVQGAWNAVANSTGSPLTVSEV